MGPLSLLPEVLLFISCTLCCKFDYFWLTNTLGLAAFGFNSQEATTVLFFWNLDYKIPDSSFNKLWGTGFDFFRILIFEVFESEFVIALGLEFFDFEMFLVLEQEASGSDWTTVSNLVPSGTKKVFNPSLMYSQHALRLISLGFPYENPIPLPLFL